MAKYQSERDIVRHAYTKLSGALSYDNSDLLEVKFTIPETYTEAGTLSLPLQILIQNEAGDKLTYKDTIVISYDNAAEAGWAEGNGTITVTNHSNTGITAVPSYKAATGYESASMTFSTSSLAVATADNGVDGAAGTAVTGTITVTPAGTLPEGTSGAVIGATTITIS